MSAPPQPPPPPPAPAPGDPAAAAGPAAGTAQPPAPRPPATGTGLGCPECGGALEVDEGLRVVVCPFCSTPLLVAGEVGVRRFAVEPAVDDGSARSATRRWLETGWSKDPALRREAALGEAMLCFLPFFRVRADVIGYAFGTEERRRTVGSGKNRRTETYEVDVERKTERSFDSTWPALNVAEWGVQRIELAGDRLVPFDPEALERLGMVFPSTGSEAEVWAAALAGFREQGDPGAGLKRVRFRFLETVRERLTVVYYPLWVLRYSFRRRSYQVLIDAEDGTLAYGKAPGNHFYRAMMLVASEAAACLIATTALQWGIDADDGCGLVAGAALLGAAIIGWGWKKFRWGGEVVEGSGVVSGPALDLSRFKKFFGQR
jgi:hypothetical protein